MEKTDPDNDTSHGSIITEVKQDNRHNPAALLNTKYISFTANYDETCANLSSNPQSSRKRYCQGMALPTGP